MDLPEPSERIAASIYKLLSEDRLSPAEKEELDSWLDYSESRRLWFNELMQYDLLAEIVRSDYERDTEKAWDRLLALNGRSRPAPHRSRLFAYLAAAAVLLAVVAGAYWYGNRRPDNLLSDSSRAGQVHASINEPPPGGNRAVLILADGRRITLDSADAGTLAQQGGTSVVKTAAGQLVYNTDRDRQPVSTEAVFNTVSTPTGGQYRLVLPDGSRVWLNAASSIYFPASFNGAARNVVVSGEAYFEIEPNPDMPFTVTTGDMRVQVLGTSFNINAYSDERGIKTTLLEGSVKVSRGGHNALLKAGQQSLVSRTENGRPIEVRKADTGQVVAWQKGMFSFKGTDIETIMRQVARWYGVEVIYKGEINDRFIGEASRDGSLSDLLTIMELTGKVKFKIAGKQVTVIPVN